jgi:hypothetical protein
VDGRDKPDNPGHDDSLVSGTRSPRLIPWVDDAAARINGGLAAELFRLD